MKIIKWGALSLAILGIIAYSQRANILYSVAGIVENIKNPVAPHREINWSSPDAADQVVSASERPPNIVLIIADDLGWNDISLNGGGVDGGSMPTPNINELAQNGVNFTQGYTADATCAPSRAAIMTGRYGTRFGFESVPVPKAMSTVASMLAQNREFEPPLILNSEDNRLPFEDLGMPTSEKTIAEILKDKGYQTGHIGKWHLGRGEGMLPQDQGFDDALLLASGMYLDADDSNSVSAQRESNAFNKFMWSVMQHAASFNGLQRFKPNGYITDYYTEEAVKFIETNKDRPFYLNLAHWAPHSPLQALKADYDSLPQIKNHTERVYAAMIKSLDRSVGRVTQALKENGLEDNTMVIFVSDNGGTHLTNLPEINQPYRGWKMTFFEGGLRTPFFVKWPAKLAPGTVVKEPVHHTDIFPTIAAASGAQLPSDRKLDGVNLLPHAQGQASGPLHKALFWRHDHYQAVLSGGWKLQVAKRPEKSWLFNLNEDPLEQKNLVSQHPEKVKELTLLLAQHNSEQMSPRWKSTIEVPVNLDKTDETAWAEEDEYVYYPN